MQFDAVCKLTEGALNPLIQMIDIDILTAAYGGPCAGPYSPKASQEGPSLEQEKVSEGRIGREELLQANSNCVIHTQHH